MKKFGVIFSLVAILATGFIACGELGDVLTATAAAAHCDFILKAVEKEYEDASSTLKSGKSYTNLLDTMVISGTIEDTTSYKVDLTVNMDKYLYLDGTRVSGTVKYDFDGDALDREVGTLKFRSTGSALTIVSDTNSNTLKFNLKYVSSRDSETGELEKEIEGSMTYDGKTYDYEDTVQGLF